MKTPASSQAPDLIRMVSWMRLCWEKVLFEMVIAAHDNKSHFQVPDRREDKPHCACSSRRPKKSRYSRPHTSLEDCWSPQSFFVVGYHKAQQKLPSWEWDKQCHRKRFHLFEQVAWWIWRRNLRGHELQLTESDEKGKKIKNCVDIKETCLGCLIEDCESVSHHEDCTLAIPLHAIHTWILYLALSLLREIGQFIYATIWTDCQDNCSFSGIKTKSVR